MKPNGPDNPDNAPLIEMITDAVGSDVHIEDRSRQFGRRSITWQIEAADGSGFYLKRNEHRKHFGVEVLALRDWASKLAAAEWWRSPSLVAVDDDLGALIMTHLPGEPLDSTESTPAERAEMFRLAGKLAAMIHTLKVDASKAGPPRSYDRELLSFFLEKAEPYADQKTLQWIEEVCGAEDAYEGLAFVPTHSDFAPRNWLVDRSNGKISLGLIDWERARPGYWLEDMQRVAQDDWLKEPDLRTAFFDGYGRFPTEREERQLNLIVLMNATGTISWAAEHDDTEFATFGHRTIERLKSVL